MSTTSYDTTTTSPNAAPSSTGRSALLRRPVWQVGAVAAVVAAIVTELFAAAAKAVDVPMEAAGMGSDTAEQIPVGGFAMSIVLWTAVGTVLAAVLARRAKRPARTFVVTTVALTALSMVGPFAATDTSTATVVVLCLSHIVAAAIVIPALATRLSHQEPTR